MLAKCANPECETPFRFFREGKLFQFDVSRATTAGPQDGRKPPRKVEHFWLCGRCSEKMTMKLERSKGPVLVRLRPYLSRHAAA